MGDDATGRVVELAAVTGRIAAVREATRTSPLGRYRAGQQQAHAVIDARDTVLALHQPCHEGAAIHGGGSLCARYHPTLHRTRPVCITCHDGTNPIRYPCPTRQALAADGEAGT